MFRGTLSFVLAVCAGIVASSAAAQQPTGQLQAIAASRTIKIAYRADAAPFSFVNQRNEITGYTIDLCKLIVASLEQRLGVKPITIQWVPVTAQSRFDAVATGKAHLECGSSSVTLARMKEVDFSAFVFVESTGLAVNTTSSNNRLLDLAGKKIAVVAGTSNEAALAAWNRAVPLPVRDRDAGIAALLGGSVDAFASDKLLLIGAQFQHPQALRILPDDLALEFYGIVLPRGDWALRLAVNTALSEIYRSGEVLKVYGQWFPQIGLRPGVLLDALYLFGAVPE
jgi:glutamate/aspartate transport system substrate-binding protein